jgi:hypothetical protein
MPTTRRQQAIQEGKLKEEKPQQTTRKNASSRSETSQKRKRAGSTTGSAPKSKKGEVTGKGEKPLSKRAKVTRDDIEQKPGHDKRPGAGDRRASTVPPRAKEGGEGRANIYKPGMPFP